MAKPKRKEPLVKARFSAGERRLLPEGSLERPALPMVKTDGKGGQPKLPSGKPGGGPPTPPPIPPPIPTPPPRPPKPPVKTKPAPPRAAMPIGVIRKASQITGVPSEELHLDPSLTPEQKKGLEFANELAYKIKTTGVPLSKEEMSEISALATGQGLGPQGEDIVALFQTQQQDAGKQRLLRHGEPPGPVAPDLITQTQAAQLEETLGDIALQPGERTLQEARIREAELREKALRAEAAPARYDLVAAGNAYTVSYREQEASDAPFDATVPYQAGLAALFPKGMEFTEAEQVGARAGFNQFLVGFAESTKASIGAQAAKVARKLEANHQARAVLESEFNAELAKPNSDLKKLISQRQEIAKLGGPSEDFLLQEARRFSILDGLFSTPGRMVFASVTGLAQELSAALGGGIPIPDFTAQRAKFTPQTFGEIMALPRTQRDIELAFIFGEQGIETAEEAVAFAARHLPAGVGPGTRYVSSR